METGERDYEGWAMLEPSATEIDDRTERTNTFDTLEEAIKFAENVLSNDHDRWLAKLEIRKVSTEIVKTAVCTCSTNKNECLVHKGW